MARSRRKPNLPGNRGHLELDQDRGPMRLFVSVLAWFLRAAHASWSDFVPENLALRQQLATYARTQKRPQLKPEERAFLDLWLADVMGIEGIPIPYGAPNASPHIERFNRSLREEAFNHFILLDLKHVRRVCAEYRDFYHRARPSQALHAIPEPYAELQEPPRSHGSLVALPVLGGVQHDYRLAA